MKNPFVSLTALAVDAAAQVEGLRGKFATALHDAFFAVYSTVKDADQGKDGEPVDLSELARKELGAFTSRFVKEAREGIRAEYTKEVQAEYDKYTDSDRAARVAMHTDANPAFKNPGVVALHRRLQVLKVRASESKRVLAAFLNGDPSAAAFYAGDLSITTALAEMSKPEPKQVTGGNSEGGESEGESQADDDTIPLPAKVAGMFATAIQTGRKGGMTNDDLLAVIARVSTELLKAEAPVQK